MSALATIALRLGKLTYPLSNKTTYLSRLAIVNSSRSQYRSYSNLGNNAEQDITSAVNDNVSVKAQVSDTQENSFSDMLRHSKLFQMGHPEGKIVEGIIHKVVGDDLYIDFGGKFSCVCQKPQSKNFRKFIRGQKVRLCLQELELSTRFLGATKDLTLCEADGYLVGTAVKVENPQL